MILLAAAGRLLIIIIISSIFFSRVVSFYLLSVFALVFKGAGADHELPPFVDTV